MDIDITIGATTIHASGVDEPGAILSPNFPTQAAHIEDALRKLPARHLEFVPPIIVGDRPRRGGGGYYRDPEPHIGLARGTFGADHNANVLFTLIHECGHAVDRAMHAVSQFVHRCGGDMANGAPGHADWATFRAISYGGVNRRRDGTPQFGEHFAEGYAIVLTHPSRITHAQQSLIRRLAAL